MISQQHYEGQGTKNIMNNFSGGSGFPQKETRILKVLEEAPVSIISFDAEGKIDFVNSAFSKMGNLYHLNTSSIVGKNVFIDEIIPDVSLREEMSGLRDGYIFEKEIKNLKTSRGFEISLVIKGSSFFEKETFAGGILVIEDIRVTAEAKENISLRLQSFQSIIKETVDFFFVIDKNGMIKHSGGNKRHLVLKENISNIKIQELIPSLPWNFDKIISDVQSKFTENKFEISLNIGQASSFYECIVSSLGDTQKPSQYLSCSFIDISEKKKTKEQAETLKLYETAAEAIADGFLVTDEKGIITHWSNSTEAFTGYSSEETNQKPVWNFIPLLNEENFKQLKHDLIQLKFLNRRVAINKKSGESTNIEASFFLSDNEISILISFFSAAKQEKEENDLKAIEENFRNLVTQSNEIIIQLDAQGIIKYVNPAFTSLLRFAGDEVLEKSFSDFVFPADQDLPILFEQRTNIELQLSGKQGNRVTFLANVTQTKSENVVSGYNLYLTDYSEKKKEEKNLSFFKFLFESNKEATVIENNGKIVIANVAFSKLYGYTSSTELTGKDFLDFVIAADALQVAEYLQNGNNKKETPGIFEFTGKKKDEATFNCELSLSSFVTEGKVYHILISRDISKRKRALQSIRESEERYSSLIESIDDFLYTFERKGRFFKPVFYTASVEKITGYTQTEMLKSLKQFLKIIHPDDFNYVKENLKNLVTSKTKTSAEIEFRIINKQGNMLWVRNKIKTMHDEYGGVKKVSGLVSDITLRKKTESDLQKSTNNLIKLNETKDKFISIISHDLRTPFSSILGFTDLILNDKTLTGEERNQYVRYIQESSNAMLSLVNSILDWTRLQTGRIRFEPQRINASELISKSIRALAGTAFHKNITINSTVPDDIFIYVDPDLITQVFNNLISNAIKFTGETGSITISAKPSSHLRFYEFSVKDTGIGIKPEDQAKLFGIDNKFTTEGTAGEKGTGLGLSLVKEIIDKHEGTIKVESEYENGSDFIFTLPIASANILLVDPKITDKILYSKILKHITSDYKIETASDGKEALDKILSSTYALVITEHKLPLITGYELALEIKKADIKMKPPVIILSGSIDRQTVDDYNEIGIRNVFQKPVDLSSFKNAVEKSLREALTNN